MKTQVSGSVKSAIRTLDLLELFCNTKKTLSFKVITAELDIPPSSLSQLLSTLIDRQYIQHVSARGGYAAGVSLTNMIQSLRKSQSLEDQVLPFLKELTADLGESAGLTTRINDEVSILVSTTSEKDLAYRITPGNRSALHLKAPGKALLAACSDSEIDAYIERTDFVSETPKSIRSGELLWEDIHKIRSEGIARSLEQSSLGVVGLAISIGEHSDSIFALAVGLPTARYNESTDTIICQRLKEVAEKLKEFLDLV